MRIEARIDFSKVHKDRGIQLTSYQPITAGPDPLLDRLREIEREPVRRLGRFVEELKQYRREYPDLPVVRQALYSTYLKLGKNDFAKREIEEAVVQFPYHLNTIVNYICSLDTEEQMVEAARFLGAKLEITHFPALEDGTYAWNDFVNYELAAIRLLAICDHDYRAKKRLEYLIQIGANTEETRDAADAIVQFCDRWKQGGFFERGKRERELAISVEPKATPLPYHWETPTFHHPEVAELYELSDDWDAFGQENVDRFLALPRATFIEDLRTVLRDVVIRNEELTEDGETYTYAFSHAIGFLAVLEAEEALPDLLNTLRADEDFIDVYYGMQTEEILYVPLYQLGKNQPQVLYDFLIEENNEDYTRASVAQVFALIALHNPARTQEIVGYYQRLFRHLLDNADQPGLIDTNFITLAVTWATDIRAPELFPQIKALYERGWVMPGMMGDLYEIEANLHFPLSPRDRKAMPEDLADYYSGGYRRQNIEDDFNLYRSPISKLLHSVRELNWQEERSSRPQAARQIQATPKSEKVGRNAPCPCGSGKKYKQCCLRK
jgi:hypothetical protein